MLNKGVFQMETAGTERVFDLRVSSCKHLRINRKYPIGGFSRVITKVQCLALDTNRKQDKSKTAPGCRRRWFESPLFHRTLRLEPFDQLSAAFVFGDTQRSPLRLGLVVNIRSVTDENFSNIHVVVKPT